MNPGTKIAGCDCIGIEIDEEDKHLEQKLWGEYAPI